jgi:hypothetical protein
VSSVPFFLLLPCVALAVWHGLQGVKALQSRALLTTCMGKTRANSLIAITVCPNTNAHLLVPPPSASTMSPRTHHLRHLPTALSLPPPASAPANGSPTCPSATATNLANCELCLQHGTARSAHWYLIATTTLVDTFGRGRSRKAWSGTCAICSANLRRVRMWLERVSGVLLGWWKGGVGMSKRRIDDD